jgi:hypothetical protein
LVKRFADAELRRDNIASIGRYKIHNKNGLFSRECSGDQDINDPRVDLQG